MVILWFVLIGVRGANGLWGPQYAYDLSYSAILTLQIPSVCVYLDDVPVDGSASELSMAW